MLSEGSFSIKSSWLNDEMWRNKRINERYALIVGLFSQLVWAVNSIQLKTYKTWFPEVFSWNSLVFWRSLSIWLISYFLIKRKGEEIIPIKNIKHQIWFWSRSAGNYLSVVLWVSMMKYFRVSTCQCIAGCHPVLVLILSVIILREKFYTRYLYGIILSIIGTGIIVSNESSKASSDSADASEDTSGRSTAILIGSCIGIVHLSVVSFSTFGQKILCKQKISPNVQNYYLGMFNTLPAWVIIIIDNHYGFSNVFYILYALSNGAIFYLANYYTTVALENIAISKFIPLTYMCTIFIFLLGFLVLHETVFFTDILGSLIIIGFQLYNTWVPIKKI